MHSGIYQCIFEGITITFKWIHLNEINNFCRSLNSLSTIRNRDKGLYSSWTVHSQGSRSKLLAIISGWLLYFRGSSNSCFNALHLSLIFSSSCLIEENSNFRVLYNQTILLYKPCSSITVSSSCFLSLYFLLRNERYAARF